MKKRRPVVYDFLCENLELRKTNSYVEEFCSIPTLQKFRNQMAEEESSPTATPSQSSTHPWRSFFNKSELKKEVTEAMSIATRIRHFLSQHQFDQVICFDICCGKGYTSICTVECCRSIQQHIQCYMLDCNKHLKMNYLKPHYETSCHFVPFTIQREENNLYTFVQRQYSALLNHNNTAIIFFGIHLCNFLSEQFVDCVQRFCKDHASMHMLSILSPCCSYENSNNTMYYQQFASTRRELEEWFQKETNYQIQNLQQYDLHYLIWIYYLKQLGKANSVKIEQDSLVLSNKNLYLTFESIPQPVKL